MKFKRSIAAAAALVMFGTSGIAVPLVQAADTTAPVYNVTFDEGSSAYELKDGAVLSDGRNGKALSLNGSGAYAAVDGAAKELKKLSGDFSISVWFNPNTVDWWRRIYDLGTGTDDYTFLTFAGNVPRFAIKQGVEQNIDSTQSVSSGEWYNIVVTRENGITTMYVDGKAMQTSTGLTFNYSEITEFTKCYLGKSQFAGDAYYDGLIDDFAIYGKALSADEIKTIAAEKYVDETAENISKYNCQILDTKYYLNDKRVLALGKEQTGEIKAVTTIKNYTASSVEMAVRTTRSIEDAVEKIGEETVTIASGETKEVTITADLTRLTAGEISTSVIDTGNSSSYTSSILPITENEVVMPQIAPADSNETTNGAHDPSIVKFPGDDTYYVYSSHHLIFTSEDLINWKKYDFTNIDAKVISPITNQFISKNYSNTTMNGTYWAPDVIYVPNDAHPYWMYISVSCGLGGRNSVISLMKSDKPLFWADKDADIIDAGVVFATKQISNGDTTYKTNSIDANIYTDKNGKQYFLWGSFWGGIQAANLNSDGFIEGLDTSKLPGSAQNFGKTIYAQKRGVAGPEGAWMIEHGDYRYLFTSYAWLGSNYNTRVARSPLSSDFAEVTKQVQGTATAQLKDTSLVDANGLPMGTQFDGSGSVTKNQITGYKMVGSFRLGEGSTTIQENTGNDWYYPREAGDAHIYYGLGHNSAITDGNGETFYVSHVRKDAVEGAAVLQVRKMLFTADGWPVINPIAYAGEKEQALPKSMIPGTYDLASVGVTKMAGSDTTINENWSNHSGNRNYDLPVISSKVTLNADGTMAGGLGTWTFDGDHTVTLTFAKDGDEAKDEFYKNGDVMTMYALLSYDKDEQDYVIALTGTDQKHITQMARKSMESVVYTEAKTVKSDPISIAKSTNGNPELGFDTNGNILYAGDPAATVIGDTVYLIVGHDTASDESYVMPDWALYTSKNLTDWEYKGSVMKATDVSWRSNDTSAWASQMVEYKGKYYLYFCTWDKTSSGKQSIGVAVADKPEGPYKDALGKPLVAGTFTAPESSGWNDIDPTVLIDTDENGIEHRYLAWGNGKYYVCELNEDMISVKDIDGDGAIVMHKDVVERKIKSLPAGHQFTEAPWLYKRDGKYYLFYAHNWREEMAYAMCDEPMGRYDFKQIIMPPNATANTNHPSVIDFNGKTYFIYHNGALPHGSGFRRSVCIQELEFDENGYVYPLTELSIGLDGTANTLVSSTGKYVAHDEFTNSLADASYPLSVAIKANDTENGYNTAWEIKPAKAAPAGENAENYVSLQSVNKPGLYISGKDGNVTLTQDADGKQGAYMTFKTVKGVDGKDNTVSFESVTEPGKYLEVVNNKLSLTYASDLAAASFVIGDVAPVAKNVIDVADVEPEPDPMAGIENNFDSAPIGTIIAMGGVEQTSEDYAGVALYLGARANDGAANTSYWAIAAGGTTGNALVMQSGKYASASRGPRMKLTDAAIPDGYTLIGSVNVKLGSDASQLYYNDSTSSESNTEITSKFSRSEYKEFKVSITNNAETYTRTIYVNGEQIAQDYISTFPVLWGTKNNSTNAQVFFDDVKIETIKPDVEEDLKLEIKAADNGKYSVSANKAIGEDCSIYIAQYDAAGRLVDIVIEKQESTINLHEGAVKIKAFAFDSKMKSEAKAAILDV